jgi:energy-coupling factor transporter ATP-binding protein EcfA2
MMKLAVYKKVPEAAPPAKGGVLDLDVTTGAQDLCAIENRLKKMNGLRGYPHPLYDNAIATRRDWFILRGDATMWHLDIAAPIVVGRKFRKRYEVEDVDWGALRSDHRRTDGADEVSILSVSLQDQARLALSKFAFNAHGLFAPQWIVCPSPLQYALEQVVTPGATAFSWRWTNERVFVDCSFNREAKTLFVSSRSLARIRTIVRSANGASYVAPLADAIIHTARRTAYGVISRIGRATGSRTIGKRRLLQGTVIALIGPDGVGKSTQSKAIADFFGRKLACAPIYFGSNDGSWMRVRKKLQLWRNRTDRPSSEHSDTAKRTWLHAHGSALWRIIVAINRRFALWQAKRLAQRGVIVIADRWPQSEEPGILDGPSLRPSAKFPLARALWSIEHRIYQKMSLHQPGLAIHLDCDFSTSHARKPGDIGANAFAARIALMERLRAKHKGVVLLDGRRSQDDVFADLLAAIWEHICATNRIEK